MLTISNNLYLKCFFFILEIENQRNTLMTRIQLKEEIKEDICTKQHVNSVKKHVYDARRVIMTNHLSFEILAAISLL